MYNNEPRGPIEQAADRPEQPVPYLTCFLCGAIAGGNLFCPCCREFARLECGPMPILDMLDDLQARKAGGFAEGAE